MSPNNHFEALSWHVVLYGNAWFAARFGANQEKSSVGCGADAGPRSKLKLRRASLLRAALPRSPKEGHLDRLVHFAHK